jgi:hypothetical protein
MSSVKYLRDNTINTIANITDAASDTDPLGTNANDEYFKSNVHNYLKEIGLILTPSKEYYVNPGFMNDSSPIGTPYFPKIYSATSAESCYAQISTDGSGANNKALVNVFAKADSYSDNMLLNHNGFVTFQGKNKHNCVISGTLTISAGIHIFDELSFSNDITISGGIVIFKNCKQTNGSTNITGAATVILIDNDQWGGISITDGLTGVVLWIIRNLDIRLIPSSSNSLLIPSGLVSFTGVFRENRFRGLISNPGSLDIENVLNKEEASAFPTIA